MSYLTLEVEIDHGQIVAKGSERLPEKGTGLLTILQTGEHEQPALTQIEALKALQERLGVDSQKAADWMAGVRNGRR